MSIKRQPGDPVDRASFQKVTTGGRTKQADAKLCDINAMIKRHERAGTSIPPATHLEYGDYTNVGDFQAAMEQLTTAQHLFGELPSAARKRFGNDAGNFLDFVADPDNLAEAIQLGLVTPPAANPVPTVEAEPGPEGPGPDPTPT